MHTSVEHKSSLLDDEGALYIAGGANRESMCKLLKCPCSAQTFLRALLAERMWELPQKSDDSEPLITY